MYSKRLAKIIGISLFSLYFAFIAINNLFNIEPTWIVMNFAFGIPVKPGHSLLIAALAQNNMATLIYVFIITSQIITASFGAIGAHQMLKHRYCGNEYFIKAKLFSFIGLYMGLVCFIVAAVATGCGVLRMIEEQCYSSSTQWSWFVLGLIVFFLLLACLEDSDLRTDKNFKHAAPPPAHQH